jgi:hypothetical protein
MPHRTKPLLVAVALAAGVSTAAFAQSNTYGSGNSDNTNSVINGSRNSQLMDRSPTYGEPTGSGHGDNTNSMTANPDDFQRDTKHSGYTSPLDNSRRVYRYDRDVYRDRDVPSGVPYNR